MSDISLCQAGGCAASTLCRRHGDCIGQYPASPLWQSYSVFEPEKGKACRGFIDCSAHWREMVL